jgi:mannose-1-phosphate guanylyltransferase
MSALIIPVILCGGAGTRLWPLSRAARPKQLLALAGGESMLRATARRVADPALFAAPWLVGSGLEAAAREVPEAALLIEEPAPRNTAPAIALAALAADPGALLIVLPSDHLVRDAAAFRAAVARAAPAAAEGWIVTFGMAAERGETGYGYIARGGEVAPGVHEAARFVEKPDAARAAAMAADGRHDWNAGIFLFRADAMLDALARHAPGVLAAARAAHDAARAHGAWLHPAAAPFAAGPAISIDHAVMEKAERVAVVPAAIGWSDLGSFAALHAEAAQDAAGNALAGDAIAIDASGCLIRSEGPLVAAIGVSDLVVIATRDAVLIVPRDQSQRVKEAVAKLAAEGRGDLL